ncbi:MAG: hypothetical protein NTV79_09715 [Candidatus Aureabacteria bacterium]|nr:hypothetical protein [Candidatus Auribacterota bacterium]
MDDGKGMGRAVRGRPGEFGAGGRGLAEKGVDIPGLGGGEAEFGEFPGLMKNRVIRDLLQI